MDKGKHYGGKGKSQGHSRMSGGNKMRGNSQSDSAGESRIMAAYRRQQNSDERKV